MYAIYNENFFSVKYKFGFRQTYIRDLINELLLYVTNTGDKKSTAVSQRCTHAGRLLESKSSSEFSHKF